MDFPRACLDDRHQHYCIPSPPPGAAGRAARRQRSEQYFTPSQSRSHFLRHVNGSVQCAQVFTGNPDFLRIFML